MNAGLSPHRSSLIVPRSSLIKIGLCGFTMAVGDYFRYFPVVEVQQTFYQPPRLETLTRWRMEAPPQFEFTMKAWQLITHQSSSRTYRRLKRTLTEEEKGGTGAFRWSGIVLEGLRVSLACAAALSATSLLFQCPSSFRPTAENVDRMKRFFLDAERPPTLRYLWEPRGEWPQELIASLCAELNLIHVVDPFVNQAVPGEITYYRLHGITGARHVYSDRELHQLADMIPADGETYVMFNNMPRIGDAARFRRILETPS